MKPPYSEAFKSRMVEKMLALGGPSATALSLEVGVSQPTLSKWVRESGRVGSMANSKRKKSSEGAKRPQDWSAEEKLQVVVEAASVSEEELGGYLRQRGLHRPTLERWRGEMLRGLESQGRRSAASSSSNSAQARKIRSLEGELRRKEKALAEAAALLILQKKVQALWGDEEDVTPPKLGS